jgi:glycosyltransferase involved in cell wall biosynthesis
VVNGTESIRWSVVVPVYGNRDALPALIERLVDLGASRAGSLEAVFVVDGSPDDSLAVLRRELADGRLRAQVLTLSRNFGSFSAIRVGLAVARGDYVAVMAADLQEPVEVVASFFDALAADECDIAVGERVGRDDPATSALASRAYWRLYQRFINPEIPTGGVDVFGCTRAIAGRIVAFPETRTSLIGLLYWIGYRRRTFPYHRQPRHSGKSGWTFRRKLRYLLDSIYAFTDLPIVLLQYLGCAGVLASVLVGAIIFVAWVLGAVRQPGYTPLMIAIAGSTSAILLALGVVGTYVWRAYENSKGRPLELVATHELIEEEPE